MTKEEYMKEALAEAKKGMGFTNPNPMVGAVIVKNGKVISKDYHHRYGEFHAERNAILKCKEDMTGAEIYVTLEPCCHYGKTPPCTEAIIQSGIRKVYIGSDDPNPLVAGKGAEILRRHGIDVETGILKDECDRLNRPFFHYITSKTPYVVMKYAMTADGKTASYSGKSKWISNELSRADVHKSRLRYAGIMTGIGTVLKDDPQLTCRLENGRNPVRIICDSNLRIPSDCNIIRSAKEVPTIIACTENAQNTEISQNPEIKIIRTSSDNGHVDLNELMQKLGEEKIDSILLEGGGELNFSALKSGIVNRIQAYISPKILGGAAAVSPVGGIGLDSPDSCVMLGEPEITRFGNDILAEWEVLKCSQE
ncbi:bifunctional diaminohydroxyphosphoribosylaminopyrimidine deaminase/5-amino-6-(5-phosphoribosylamino)uracil reductase RibD [Porcipelethomonas sp.]|uniref:bifunctional diaminohydroxyphosphoribosylaminopyrimidine deaminase/5-amino-6-(5-phosphoribosylamino)uracil reductase RibD n=1 Tax=Porcipelethomonas sp. TaxID=2981675 RepID=UPI003EF467ED